MLSIPISNFPTHALHQRFMCHIRQWSVPQRFYKKHIKRIPSIYEREELLLLPRVVEIIRLKNMKENPFAVRARPMQDHQRNMLIGIFAVLALIFLATPNLPLNVHTDLQTKATPVSEFLPSADILHYTLPGSNNIAPGSVNGHNGFVYIIDADDVAVFHDPVQDVTIELQLPTGTTTSLIFAADIDNDGNTEFMTQHDMGSSPDNVLVMDFDAGTAESYPTNCNIPRVKGVGDFNDDGFLDLFIWDANTQRRVETIDIEHNNSIGVLTTDQSSESIYWMDVGKFHPGGKDYLVLAIREGGISYRNITIADGNGTLVKQIDHLPEVRDIIGINHGGPLEDIAVIDQGGNLTLYNCEDLSIAYNVEIGSTASSCHLISANLTLDSYEDLYILDSGTDSAFLVDGFNGNTLMVSPNVDTALQVYHDSGFLDSDERTDLVIRHSSGSPALLRGVDGRISYVEYLVESPDQNQIFASRINGDDRDDMLVRDGTEVYAILSDVDAPILTPHPIDPLHPTMNDDYITMSVAVDEGSVVESAQLVYRRSIGGSWTNVNMSPDAANEDYYYFLVGLDDGDYDYFYIFQDAYLNTATYGNVSNPNTFSVKGHFDWRKTLFEGNNYTREVSRPDLITRGNQSDGSIVIYMLQSSTVSARLYSYSEEGALIDYMDLVWFEGYQYVLLSGNFDGDNVTDPVVLSSTKTETYAHVIHGVNFTLNFD